nr:DUF1343 domain-containing protein [Mariniflexile sp.]
MVKLITKITFLIFLLSYIPTNIYAFQKIAQNKGTKYNRNAIKTGADNYEMYLPLLKNKKVGIITNQTGILSNKTHLVDFLLEKKIALQTIFAPEHGFRGTADAGEVGAGDFAEVRA